MATATALYGGASGTAYTITLASLAVNAAQQATFVSNQAATLALDISVSGFVAVGAAAAIGNCWVLAAGYDGTTFPWGGAAILAASTAVVVMNRSLFSLDSLQYGQTVPGTSLVFLATIPTAGLAATTLNVGFGPVNMSQAFQMGGLTLPAQHAVVVVNGQGQAFDATTGHFGMFYNTVKQTIA